MLPRLLFVAGMTIGVMAPLIWAAYVSVPAFRAVPERAGDWGQRDAVGTALRETPKPQSASHSAPTTSSIETAAAAVSNSPQPKSDLKSVTAPASPSLEPEPEQLTKPIRPQAYDQKADQAPPSSEKAKPAPAEDVTSTVSIPPAPEKTLQGKPPQGAPDAPRNEKRRASSKGESTRKLVERAPLKDVPDVVDLYSGPHIIIVCSELTRLQKLRMGCP
jgi:hypothetical protein